MAQRRPSVKAEARRKKTILKDLTKQKWKLQKKKPLEVSLREHLGKIIDNTKVMDIAKLTATLGMTLVIHDLIRTTEGLLNQVKNIAFPNIGQESFTVIGRAATEDEKQRWKEFQASGFLSFEDWKVWLFSFTIAYVIIDNFGAIGQFAMQMGGGLVGFIRLFLV